jgi:acetate kinase
MKILTLNCGSSSLKYSFWSASSNDITKLCDGIVENVTVKSGSIQHELPGGRKIIEQHECPDHATALQLVIKVLTSPVHGVIGDLSEIDAVTHRVVHGGEKFRKSILIDNSVLEGIRECSTLAPLHNPPNLLGIETAMALMPKVPQIAVFDTTFFTTMPPSSYIYAVPYEWYQKYGIRRYGFHGSSHLYVSRKVAALLKKKPSEINVIILHIGNGVSVTAVRKGEAYDHSLGFTPLEGAVMGTRCGDLDPGIVLYIMEKENLSPSQMLAILNKNCGLLGITGQYTDRRDIIKMAEGGDKRSELAIEIECYRLKKYIGAYLAALGTVDSIVFTAGVGENSAIHRQKICENLDSFGISIDSNKNNSIGKNKIEKEISSSTSRIKVFVIPTNEELVFIEDTIGILQGDYSEYTQSEYSFQKY